ncbi:MAG: DUF1353 domain-containing protein [Salinibacterium sp.]|nr:DUF1353 domain-containing protein [Salinibacterium sp.]
MFVDSDRAKLTTIELAQVPIAAPTFQLRQTIGYYEGMGEAPPSAEITWAHRHEPDLHPEPGNRTDLASVPTLFWSLIASYGRQTAPAVVHDSECWKVYSDHQSGLIDSREAVARRVRIDRAFRLGLRELEVAPFRSWLMWTFVSLERYQKHAVAAFVGYLVLAAFGLALIVGAPVAALAFGLPWWVGAVMLTAPLVTSLLGRQWRVLVWASYAGALLVPVVILQLAAYVPYVLLENVIWFAIDGRKKRGSPVIGPIDVKNIRRASTT